VAGAAVVLIPNFPLVTMTILSQVLNGVLLPFVLFFMLRLVNDKALMGKHTNSHWFNVVAWATTVIVIGLTVVMLWQSLHQVTSRELASKGG
jgi:Mn2+/Fe2+ NRAMP family transporter